MTGSILLDTNIIIPHLRKSGKPLAKPNPSTSLCVSPIVLGELFYGAQYSSNPTGNVQAIEMMLPALDQLPLDDDTVRAYGELKAQLRKQGTPLPENDVWIAATALRYDIPLATNDDHFNKVPKLIVTTLQVKQE